jgi:hypothetical protein
LKTKGETTVDTAVESRIDQKPKIPAELLAQLLFDAAQKAAKSGHIGKLRYCGEKRNWEDCVMVERVGDKTIAMLYFNVGVDTLAVTRRI